MPGARSLMKSVAARTLMVCLPLVMAAGVASADTTYTYSGQAFTTDTCLFGLFCAGSVGAGPITLSFTESAPLAANLTGAIDGVMADLTAVGATPTSFSIFDGLNKFQGVSSATNFYVETDASGNIIAWNIGYYNGFYGEVSINNPVTVYDGAASYCFPSNQCETFHYVASPGTWVETQTGTGVPEPSSVILLATGLASIATLRRRSVQKTSH